MPGQEPQGWSPSSTVGRGPALQLVPTVDWKGEGPWAQSGAALQGAGWFLYWCLSQ